MNAKYHLKSGLMTLFLSAFSSFSILQASPWLDLATTFLPATDSFFEFNIPQYPGLSELPGTNSIEATESADSDALTVIVTNDNYYEISEVFVPHIQEGEIIWVALRLSEPASDETLNILPEECIPGKSVIACGIESHHEGYLKVTTREAIDFDDFRLISSDSYVPGIYPITGKGETGSTVMVNMLKFGASGGDREDDDPSRWRKYKLLPEGGVSEVEKDDEFYRQLISDIKHGKLDSDPQIDIWASDHGIDSESLKSLVTMIKKPLQRQSPLRPSYFGRGAGPCRRYSKGHGHRTFAPYSVLSGTPQSNSLGFGLFQNPQIIQLLVDAYNNGELGDDVQKGIFISDHSLDSDSLAKWIERYSIYKATGQIILVVTTPAESANTASVSQANEAMELQTEQATGYTLKPPFEPKFDFDGRPIP